MNNTWPLLAGFATGQIGTGIAAALILTALRRRKPRYMAVIVSRTSKEIVPLSNVTFRSHFLAQEWCQQMNVAHDLLASFDEPASRPPMTYQVRALPFKAEQEVR